MAIARVLALGLLLACPAAAQFAPPTIVDPATYRSCSGEFVLEVDPSHIYGAGPANYRLSRAGRAVWSGERPFTLVHAGVANHGSVAGYAYTNGLGYGDPGTLLLVILDPAGAVRLQDPTPRRESLVVDGGPEPNAEGLVFDPDNDRVVFRVSDVAAPEVWKTFRLSTGTPGPILKPAALTPPGDLSLSIVDAKPVRGTPLVLVHWSRIDWNKSQQGARFTLIDLTGRVTWMLDLPTDYQPSTGNDDAQERASRLMSTTAILETGTPMEFELRHAASSEHVRYRVDTDESGGWKVEEVGRQAEPDPLAHPAPTTAPGPEKALRYLGSFELGGSSATRSSPIRDVHRFDLDDSGRYGFVRRDGSCDLTFVAGTTAKDARSIHLGRPGQQECSAPLVAWVEGNTWLVTLEYAKAESGPAGWWVDRAAGAVRPFVLPAGVSSVRAVAGSRSGGVVLLAESAKADGLVTTISTLLFRIDALGNEDRGFRVAANGSDSELLSPDDVAVLASGEVVVVDVIRHSVAVFRTDGTFQRTIDLEKAWGREPRYPCGVAPDADGGFIIEDFNGRAPFVRMRIDGSVRTELVPRYGDGHPAGRLFRVQAGPDGTLWGSDGEALLQLGDDGLVTGSVGASASVDDLGEAAAVVLDGADRVYAVDRRTAAVHVFASDGKLDHVCRPRAGDLEGSLTSPSLSVAQDGRVFLGLDEALEPRGYLEFSAAGDRVARHRWDERSRAWNPAAGGFWAIRDDEVVAIDEKGRVTAEVARRRDRRWLGWITGIAVAPDGSLAVDASSRVFTRDQESSLNLYAPNGKPIGLIQLRPSTSSGVFAYDGRNVAFWESGEVSVLDAAGEPVAHFKPRPQEREAADWPLFLAAQGRELWMFDSAEKAMHRYELP